MKASAACGRSAFNSGRVQISGSDPSGASKVREQH